MSIASYIKVIGRGKDGARGITAEQALDLMDQVLSGRVTDLEVGAFALAMRIKGETPAELAGFLAAAQAHMALTLPAQPAVWLPSYNGSRKLPNLTALLALLLARRGVPVLVHGPQTDPGRVTTHDIFQALALPIAQQADDIATAWHNGLPVFVPIHVLNPALARLLDVRWTVGLRNSGHTIAKLLHPAGSLRHFRVVNYTHPEYLQSLTAFLAESHADALLMRGTEGEPVADTRRRPRMDVFIGGACSDALSLPAREGVLATVPDLPADGSAQSTAAFIAAVREGRLPVPEVLLEQVECLVAAMTHLSKEAA